MTWRDGCSLKVLVLMLCTAMPVLRCLLCPGSLATMISLFEVTGELLVVW